MPAPSSRSSRRASAIWCSAECSWRTSGDGILDPGTLRVDRHAYAPIGRLFGGGYVRTHDRFEMPRLRYQQWLERTRADGEK
jgi:hypothetical protein